VFAEVASLEPAELNRGEAWGALVESYDGKVVLRWYSPFGKGVTRIPLTVAAAIQLADMIKFKAQQAAYKMRFVTQYLGRN